MAKRKLSEEKRAQLRVDLKKGIDSGKKRADVLREIAEKYAITTITARWYLTSIGMAPKRRGAGKRGPGRPPGSSKRRAGSELPKNLSQLVEAQSAKATEARKLAPRWQRLVDKESALRRQALKVARKLEAVSKNAAKLGQRIQELIR